MMTDEEIDEALAGFRDDVPEMSDTGFLLGKVRLQAAVQDSAEPVPPLQPLQVRVEYVDGRSRRSPPRRKMAPWLIAAAAAAAVAVGGALFVSVDQPVAPAGNTLQTVNPPMPSRPFPGRNGHQGTPLLPAAQPYNDAGSLAANVSDLPQPPGRYLYLYRNDVSLKYELDTQDSIRLTMKSSDSWEEWVPADRSGPWYARRAVDNSTPAVLQGAGGGYFAAAGTWDAPTTSFIASLPREPRALYNRLAQDSAGSADPPSTAFQMASSVLNRPVPAEFRRVLFQALSYHPWVVVDKEQIRDGREVVTLGLDDQLTGQFETVLIDPANGLVAGTKAVKYPGTLTRESVVRWSIVGKPGDRI